MTSVLDRFLDAQPDHQDLHAFLESHEFPLVEGSDVTFVYHGSADRVELKHFIFGLETGQILDPVQDLDLWHTTLQLPRGSRVEYKFEVHQGESRSWVRDPLNPHLARDPFGANSVAHSEGYVEPEWAHPDPEARPGSFENLMVSSAAFGEQRRVGVYLPARFRPRARYPLLIVHDGFEYLDYSGLKTVLDNLIHRHEIPPMIVALTQAPGDQRLVEYGANPKHARFLVEELLPAMEERYPLTDAPGSRGLMGASFGAVASLHAAWSYPGTFDRLLLQSGSFAFTDIGEHQKGPVFDPVVAFVNRFRSRPGRPADKLFICCGTYERPIYYNRSLIPLLRESGLEVRYVEARDGHNWENWRDRLREGLSWLFPGPLWMVYE
ncbi:MAG: alpha/beta hydrolase-fold protein [Acidobacteriota bacterium]